MGIFVRAVVSGFGFSLGAALYKKVSGKLGLDEGKAKEPAANASVDAGAEQSESAAEPVRGDIEDAVIV